MSFEILGEDERGTILRADDQTLKAVAVALGQMRDETEGRLVEKAYDALADEGYDPDFGDAGDYEVYVRENPHAADEPVIVFGDRS